MKESSVSRDGPQFARISIALISAIAFGMVMSVIKGNTSGIRDVIGNASAPWLILPFAGGAAAAGRSVGRAALLGCVVSLAALASFYLANSVVLDLGPHPWVRDLVLTVEGGRRYFFLGLLSGPVFGALGGLWARNRATLLVTGIACLLVFEPFAWLIYERFRPATYVNYPLVWGVEAVIGIAAAIAVGTISRDSRRSNRAGPPARCDNSLSTG